MYINPPHRFTVYAMGIGLGYVLRMFKDLKLSQSQLKIGWYLSTASLLLAFFGPAKMGDIDYKFNATHASYYAAFAPIAWCIFFGWIILVSQLGYKSLYNRLMMWVGQKIIFSTFLQINLHKHSSGEDFLFARESLTDFISHSSQYFSIMSEESGLRSTMDSSRQL